jgi:hypothetical protein
MKPAQAAVGFKAEPVDIFRGSKKYLPRSATVVGMAGERKRQS